MFVDLVNNPAKSMVVVRIMAKYITGEYVHKLVVCYVGRFVPMIFCILIPIRPSFGVTIFNTSNKAY